MSEKRPIDRVRLGGGAYDCRSKGERERGTP